MSLEMSFAGGQRRLRFRLRPLLVPPSAEGLFDQGSVIRRVYGDSVCSLGAGTALLLQLAHPSVAAGVHDHSDYENRPLDRLFGTLFATSTVVFGSHDEVERIRTVMAGVHERVVGPAYHALDPELLCWVNATLFATAVQLYERLIHPLSAAELDDFARDSRRVAEVFGCPIEAQPASWPAFESYWRDTVAELSVSDTARAVATSLLSGRGLPLRPMWLPSLSAARAVTAATLPPRIRRQYGLPWRRVDRAIATTVLGTASAVLPRLPDRWRQLGPELMRAPRNSHGASSSVAA
ncbi:MAG TPA: oxygenase MpaB family protein [Acidimicrobiales bacterium]